MKLAIMQPYYFPYIGYFQLIGAVDRFVIYDNIKYTKKGWINRNRILVNGADATFSLPLKSGSDALQVRDREISDAFSPDKFLSQLRGAYQKAPHFAATMELVERVVRTPHRNLFDFLKHSVLETSAHLGLETDFVVSSSVAIDHDLKAADKVLALCAALGATTYVNPIGGQELYDRDAFAAHGVRLQFLKSQPIEYAQFGAPFVPWLSILDVLMFNARDAVRTRFLTGYELI